MDERAWNRVRKDDMNRTIPYFPEVFCDVCGALGAYDVMGDYFCDKCMEDFTQEDEQPTDGQKEG